MTMNQAYTTTNSERSCFQRCRHLWFLTYGLGLVKVYDAEPLIFGRLWHQVLEQWWEQWKDGTPYYSLIANAHDFIDDKCESLASKIDPRFGADPTAYSEDDINEMHGIMQAMVVGYTDRYNNQQNAGFAQSMIGNELQIAVSTRTPLKGRQSVVSRFAGTIDKLVRDSYGQVWILEHKTTKYSLDSWMDLHSYSPQALSYAWLVQEQTGHRVEGVIYDLALKAVPPRPEAIQPIANGKRLSRRLPANTTKSILERALQHHNIEPDEWTQDKLRHLGSQPDPFFQRKIARFQQSEIVRTGIELYHIATEIRRAHSPLREHRLRLIQQEPSRYLWTEHANAIIHYHGNHYPRNNDSCYAWSRPCGHMDLCRYQSRSALAHYKMRERRYIGVAQGI